MLQQRVEWNDEEASGDPQSTQIPHHAIVGARGVGAQELRKAHDCFRHLRVVDGNKGVSGNVRSGKIGRA